MTMSLVSTTTVGSGGAATITINSIPQTGDDLLVIFNLRQNVNRTDAYFELNGVNVNSRNLYGTGTGVFTQNILTDPLIGTVNSDSYAPSTFSNGQLYIPNYKSSVNKTMSFEYATENNASANVLGISTGLAATTSPVTWIRLSAYGTFMQYSTVSLYTITRGSGGATVS